MGGGQAAGARGALVSTEGAVRALPKAESLVGFSAPLCRAGPLRRLSGAYTGTSQAASTPAHAFRGQDHAMSCSCDVFRGAAVALNCVRCVGCHT
jgi:hypothetical protein